MTLLAAHEAIMRRWYAAWLERQRERIERVFAVRAEHGGGEYTDAKCRRFEATADRKRVTCKACERAARRTCRYGSPERERGR